MASGGGPSPLEEMRGLRAAVASMPVAAGDAEGTSRDYLLAFADMALSSPDLPRDKLARWAGFVRGVLASRGLADAPDAPRGSGSDCPVAFAHRQVLEGLAGPASARGGQLVDYVAALLAVHGADPAEIGLCTGYVQGVLTAEGFLTVAAERDRTRPFFHAAYRASGTAVPSSREVAR